MSIIEGHCGGKKDRFGINGFGLEIVSQALHMEGAGEAPPDFFARPR
jgi:hypothetical protein